MSSSSVLGMSKPKLRFSIDALMGKESDDSSYGGNLTPPIDVQDYSVSKLSSEVSPTRCRGKSPPPPVLVPIPTFPAGVSASSTVTTVMSSRDRPGFFNPTSAVLYQRTFPQCAPGLEPALSGMFLPGDPYQSLPWFLHRPRFLHHTFRSGPELPGFLLPPFRKAKRIRTAFSASQLMKLEGAFDKNHYVTGNERKQLAESLGLTETQVKVWFQNRRTKQKRQVLEDRERQGTNDSLSLHKGVNSQRQSSSVLDTNLSPPEENDIKDMYEDEDSDDIYSTEDGCETKEH